MLASNLGHVLWYEFLENLPSMCSLVGAVWLWRHQKRSFAGGLLIVGAIGSAILIQWLEPIKVAPTRLAFAADPIDWGSTELWFNAGSFIVTATLAVWYFQAQWSNWKTDCLVGIGLALLTVGGQATALWLESPTSFSLQRSLTHTIAFLAAGAVGLLGVRWAQNQRGRWVVPLALVITAILSLIITIIDYGLYV